VFKRIFRLKRDEVIGGWRKLHNEDLHNLYFLQNAIGMTKSKMVGWAGIHTGCWYKIQKERDRYEDLDVGRKIIIIWILGK
jgi:hypothetical protein